MKLFVASLLTLTLTTCAYAIDLPKGEGHGEQCVEEKIVVEKLKQENAKLVQQLMQAQYGASEQALTAAQAEEKRLHDLLPKPKSEK